MCPALGMLWCFAFVSTVCSIYGVTDAKVRDSWRKLLFNLLLYG